MSKRLLPLLFLVSWISCTAYEYEEDVYVAVDGSGRIRVSGSKPLLTALYGERARTTEGLAELFGAGALELDATRETTRDGRGFLHVTGRFHDWRDVCRLPVLGNRSCSIRSGEKDLILTMTVPPPADPAPQGADPEAVLAFRFHLPSTVRAHSSPDPIQRGNILEWKRTVAEHFGGEPVSVEARFDRRSVLATTVRILAIALGAVVLVVATALAVMVRKGRRQLAAEARTAFASRSR